MKKTFLSLLCLLASTAYAQQNIIAKKAEVKDSLKLGNVWRSTWPAGTVSAANNGLSLSGSTTQLGGGLVKNTTVSGKGSYSLYIDSADFRSYIYNGTTVGILNNTASGANLVNVKGSYQYAAVVQVCNNNSGNFSGVSVRPWSVGLANVLNTSKKNYLLIDSNVIRGSADSIKFTAPANIGNLSILTGGNVGVGTALPAVPIDVLGTATAAAAISAKFVAGTSAAAGGLQIGSYSSTYGGIWGLGITPTISNYSFITDGGNTYVNGTGSLSLAGNGTSISINGSNISVNKQISSTANGSASVPLLILSGTTFTGGTATTTKPSLLIEPSGTTSTNWNTAGTLLGINAASGFAGNYMDIQQNGANILKAYQSGGNTTVLDAGSSRLKLVSNTGVLILNDGNADVTLTSGVLHLGGRSLNLTTSVFWKSGTGSPEGVITASIGSLYSRTDGGANTTLYVKESGTGNTGWVAK